MLQDDESLTSECIVRHVGGYMNSSPTVQNSIYRPIYPHPLLHRVFLPLRRHHLRSFTCRSGHTRPMRRMICQRRRADEGGPDLMEPRWARRRCLREGAVPAVWCASCFTYALSFIPAVSPPRSLVFRLLIRSTSQTRCSFDTESKYSVGR